MKKKSKKKLAFLLALAMIVSLMGRNRLFVAAQEQTVETQSAGEAAAWTETAASEKASEPEMIPIESAECSGSTQEKEEGSSVPAEAAYTESDSGENSAEECSTEENAEMTSEEGSGTETETAGEKTEEAETEETEETEETVGTEETEETEETETKEATEPEEAAAKETDAEDAGFKGSEKNPWSVEADMQNSGTGITIRAFAEKGVLPEDAVLYARELKKTEEEYREAENLVGKSDGKEMLALDIGFTVIKDGTETAVEPEGEVRIEMDLDNIVPADAEEASLKIEHITENENGERKAVTVADRGNETEGTVAVVDTGEKDTQDVKAEFVTDCFSTFTITWNKGDWWNGNARSITVRYVDETGAELSGFSQTDISDLVTGNEITLKDYTLKDYAAGLSDYTYQGAKIGNVNGSALTQVRVIRENLSDVSLQYRNGKEDWKPLNNESVIMLVYKRTSDPVEPVAPVIAMSHEKYVTGREDGSYDLTLTVAGAVGSQQNKQKLDVIFVLDRSGSMGESMGNSTRREVAGNAINEMVDSLSSNENIDTRYALVTFSGSRDYIFLGNTDAKVSVDWTEDANNIQKASSPNSDGGTNYQAGIIEAKMLLEKKREGAITAVIFVSDGNPTFYYATNEDGSVDKNSTQGSGSKYDPAAMAAAQNELTTLKSDFFYTIGVGDPNEFDRLKELIADGEGTYYSGGISGNYAGTDEASLRSAFDSIEASITKVLCSDVTVTDQLSDNVSIVKKDDGSTEELKITVKDEDGKEVTSGYGSVEFDGIKISASYDEAQKKITMDFPDNYKLKEGYTYLVTAHIEPTEAAYVSYRGNGNAYPNTGERGTGETSAEKSGLFSNAAGSAVVTYTYNNSKQTAAYPMPVIQLHPAVLTIEKKIEGLDRNSEKYRELCAKLKFHISCNGIDEVIALSGFKYDEQDQKFIYIKSGISPGTVYRIWEDQASIAVEGYDCIQTSGNKGMPIEYTGSFEKDGKVNVSFCNTYIPSDHVLTVRKVVEGNMGDTEKEFGFTLVVKGKNGEGYTKDISYVKHKKGSEGDGESGVLKIQDDGYYAFTLKHNQSIELTLPNLCTYTVTESNEGYGVVITNNSDNNRIEDHVMTKPLEKDITVIFTNTCQVVAPPTGVLTDSVPGLFMILTAFTAALWFASTRRKRIRH